MRLWLRSRGSWGWRRGHKMFNIAERRRLWYTISALVIIPGIIAMIYSTIIYGSPVRLSIDFTGGSLFEVKFEDTATEQGIREVYTDLGQDDPIIQRLGDTADNTWQIRAGSLTPEEETAIRNGLNERVAPVDDDQSQFTNVDPSIGR